MSYSVNDFRLSKLVVCCALLSTAGIAQYYTISTVAGNGQIQLGGLGGRALSASLVSPRQVAADSLGNLYFSDAYFHQVYRVSADGVITLFAGSSQRGFRGDGGAAAEAQLDSPTGVLVDSAGTVYIADTGNNRVRRVRGGVISTVAGDGRASIVGDGGQATAAAVGGPTTLAFDTQGNLYICEPGFHVVRMMKTDGTMARVAGTGTTGFTGDGGSANAATLFTPSGVAVDSAGSVYIADTTNNRIRKVTGGVITTVAGNGSTTFGGDGGLATAAALALPSAVTVDADGNLFIADNSHGRIRRMTPAGIISTVAGGGSSLVDGPSLQASVAGMTGIAFDSRGGIVLVAGAYRQIRRLNLAAQSIATVAGVLPVAGIGDNVSATSSPLLAPFGVAVDSAGNFYVSDQTDHRIRKVTPAGVITTVAGTGVFGGSGEGGAAINAQVGAPRSLSIDAAGNMYLVTGFSAGIRKISSTGTISEAAGGNGGGYAGDGGPALAAQMLNPLGVTTDATGNLFVSDNGNSRVRKVDATTKVITTVAGTGVAGFSGDSGPGTGAQISLPRQLAIDRAGNLLIADTTNGRIRRLSPAGVISTAVPDVPGVTGVAVDGDGNIFIANSNAIRKVDAATGTVSRIAGTGAPGFSGDGGLATNAQMNSPQTVAVDASGNVYFTDEQNLRVRKLTPVQIVAEGVTNAGTQKAGGVAPGEIITIYGFNLGPSSPAGVRLDGAGKVATETGGTQVKFDDVPAPMLYASPNQVNVVVPYGVSGSTKVQVVYQGRVTNTITLPVVASSPGLFAITNQDGSVNSAGNRAAQGSILILYGTGEGQTNPGGVDGAVANSVYPKPALPVSVQVGGQAAEILYVGAAPGFVSGVLQMNVRLPGGVTGTVPLELKIGESSLPAGTTVSIR